MTRHRRWAAHLTLDQLSEIVIRLEPHITVNYGKAGGRTNGSEALVDAVDELRSVMDLAIAAELQALDEQ